MPSPTNENGGPIREFTSRQWLWLPMINRDSWGYSYFIVRGEILAQLLETLLAPENPIESALVANIHTVMAIWMMTNGLPCFREQVMNMEKNMELVRSIKKIGTIAIEYRK
jgi:hypothetical protein